VGLVSSLDSIINSSRRLYNVSVEILKCFIFEISLLNSNIYKYHIIKIIMVKNKMLDAVPEYDGLIFYDVDYDKLAAEVGKSLEHNPPTGIKVLRYAGKKDYLGFHKVADEYEYADEVLNDYTYEEYKNLCEMDRPIFKQVYEWEKEMMKRYKSKFSIELHDTPLRTDYLGRKEPLLTEINLSTVSFNRKIYNLLKKYCEITRPAFNESEVQRLRIRSSPLGSTPYHQIEVEIYHDPKHINKPQAIDDVSNLITNLSQYMRNEYPKLWKKHIR